MNTPAALLQRLDDIGRALANDDDALALIALGSAGREVHRLDAYSDLDFTVVVRPQARARFLSNLSWLEAIAAVAFHYRGPRDVLHVLFADGIHCEAAVFTVAGLATTAYAPGRMVWKRPWVDEALAQPARVPPTGRTRDVDSLVSEILWELYVGLLRWRRGERQAAVREIQQLAVDRWLELVALVEPEATAVADPFAPARRFEQRFPQLAGYLAEFQQGYARTPQSAAAMLDFLAERFSLNEAMVAAIRQSLHETSIVL